MPHLRALVRAMTVAQRAPRWARPIVYGAFLPIAFMYSGVLGLLTAALLTALSVRALGLIAIPLIAASLVLTVVAGAAGGAAYSLIEAHLRPSGLAGNFVTWLGAIYTYLGILAGAVLLTPLARSLDLVHPTMLVALLLGGGFYAAVLAWTTHQPADPYEFLNR